MRHNDLEKRMRSREWFHSLTLVPGAWAVVRVDESGAGGGYGRGQGRPDRRSIATGLWMLPGG